MNFCLISPSRHGVSSPPGRVRRLARSSKAAIVAPFVALALGTAVTPATACPFCSAASQTLSEEIRGAAVAVLAERILPDPSTSLTSDGKPAVGRAKGAEQSATVEQGSVTDSTMGGGDPGTGMATFRILHTIRGKEATGNKQQLQVVYFGDPQPKKTFLLTGLISSALGVAPGGAETDSGKQRIDWSTPLPLSPAGVEYVQQLDTLPEKGPKRLFFFMNYLENDDPLLAQDAYDEFSRAPYSQLVELGDQMDRNRLVTWINDPQVGPTRRRLYLTMLGVCGQAQDIEMLERLLQYDYRQIKPGLAAMVSFAGLAGSAMGLPIVEELVKAETRRKKQCLDALVACYLKLKGPAGLKLVEEEFLKNSAAEYTYVYATIMALRFHGEETDVIPRQRLLQSLHLVLDNPEIADQVIPDLTRWEDWGVLERLVTMFKASDQDGWIRQPVISYLIVAAEQTGAVGNRAKQALTELKQLDPKTVERARSLMAFSGFGRAAASKSPAQANAVADQTSIHPSGRDSLAPNDPAPDNSAKNIQAGKDGQAGNTQAEDGPAEGNQAAGETTARQTVDSRPTALDSQPPAPDSSHENKPADRAATASQTSRPPHSPAATMTPKGAPPEPPSRLAMIGIPLLAGLVLMGIFAVLLRGNDFRAPS